MQLKTWCMSNELYILLYVLALQSILWLTLINYVNYKHLYLQYESAYSKEDIHIM